MFERLGDAERPIEIAGEGNCHPNDRRVLLFDVTPQSGEHEVISRAGRDTEGAENRIERRCGRANLFR